MSLRHRHHHRVLPLIGLTLLVTGLAFAQDSPSASPEEALQLRRRGLEAQIEEVRRASLTRRETARSTGLRRESAGGPPEARTLSDQLGRVLGAYVRPQNAVARAGRTSDLTVKMRSGEERPSHAVANLLAQQALDLPLSSELETIRVLKIQRVDVHDNRAIVKVVYTLLFRDPEDQSGQSWRASFRDSRGMQQTAQASATETWELAPGASNLIPGNWFFVRSEQPTEPSASVPLSNECEPDYWEQYLLGLELHPIGFSRVHITPENLMEHLTSNLIRMHPAGFAADHYTMGLGPTAGQRNGLEWTPLFVTGAKELGRSATRLYYGFGLQQQLTPMRHSSSALSVGGYSYWGPHHHLGGTVYLVDTRRLWRGREDEAQALFGHVGVKLEMFHLDSDHAGIRPFIGINAAPLRGRRFYLSAEFSPRQPWERAHQYALRGRVVLGGLQLGGAKLRATLSLGMQNNGYRTRPVLALGF